MTFTSAYHVGIVVQDLVTSCEEMSDLLGVKWAEPVVRDFTAETPGGQQGLSLRYTYSNPASGACLLEVIQGSRGTLWWPGDDRSWAFHHIGLWTENLIGLSDSLSLGGAEFKLTMSGPEPRNLFAFHQLKNGPLVEVVDTIRQGPFYEWIES